jgi:23S rRNA (cytosine1962-C5)-methyltransferase
MPDPRAIWPDFDPQRIAFEDDALLVVDKPAGVPTQASSEELADDLPSRLRAFLQARDDRAAYLGIHQRLDRATSGLVVYAKKKEANRGLAEQFEGRTVEKRYVAAVEGLRGPPERTLRHRLGPLDDGRVAVVGPNDRRGQTAVTHVTARDRRGTRALVELLLETGRTHQARVQLAAEGAPIAGDRLYGGPAAPRMMLHASSLSLRHPIDGRSLRIERPPPRAFARWLAHGDRDPVATFDPEAFDDALDLAREERFALGRADDTTAFRLINEGGDGLPGLSVDVYGDHLVAHLYVDDPEPALLDRLEALGFDGIYLKVRPKQANVIVDARSERFAPKGPIRGRAAPDEFEIREHGLPFLVRLGDGLSTGIFLDQRENRRRVRVLSAGKRVLNLFSYTCPFTIAAAAGGAHRTVSVDAARPAIERGMRGLAHAGLGGDHHEFVVDDVFAWLDEARRRRDQYDLVILDPPSYSVVGRSRFSAASDWRSLSARALSVVAPGGRLLACTNHRQTVQAKLRRLLHEAARDAGRTVVQMKDLPPPIDFPAAFGLEPHLKSILVHVG